MGRFDYPSPYWDSVGDPALDLIDRMLTVDVDQRITVDECLEHPWITHRHHNPADSTDGLTGAMDQLDFSKRKFARERTLLSDLNEVKVSKIIEWEDKKAPVKVFDKNPDGKRVHNTQMKPATNGYVPRHEEPPAAHQQAEVFMGLGERVTRFFLETIVEAVTSAMKFRNELCILDFLMFQFLTCLRSDLYI